MTVRFFEPSVWLRWFFHEVGSISHYFGTEKLSLTSMHFLHFADHLIRESKQPSKS